jgi:hypothetical protein
MMALQTVPNTRIKGVRWLAELYKNRQVDAVTAQTLNKLVDLETSRLRLQLEDMERVMADYERQYGMKSADFFAQFEAGKLGDRMDFMEWSGLFQMAADLRKQLDELANEG